METNYSVKESVKDPVNNFTQLEHLNENSEIENQLAAFKEEKVAGLKHIIILRPMTISLAALIISFFIDLAYVPFLGNVSTNIAKSIFPGWEPLNQSIQPLSFWWIPVVAYGIFVAFAFKTFNDLKREIKDSTSSEIIDRLAGSSISVVDGISTALPLIGAAILLISIKLGPEIFLALSVPFEIKALIVLALGKLFEPVFDKIGVEFQHVINRASELKEKYYAQIQVRSTNKLLKQIETQFTRLTLNGNHSADEIAKYNSMLENSANLAKETYKYLHASSQLMEKINSLPEINHQRLEELKLISTSIRTVTDSLKEEKTIAALKSLENIVVRK